MKKKQCKNLTKLNQLHRIFSENWSSARKFLSFFDWFRFCRYLSEIDQRKREQVEAKHFRNLNWLLKQRFGSFMTDSGKNICNLSSHQLSDTERFVLSHGLEFCYLQLISDVKKYSLSLKFYSDNSFTIRPNPKII